MPNTRRTKTSKRRSRNPAKDAVVYSYVNNPPRAPSLANQIFHTTQTSITPAWFSTSVATPSFIGLVFALNQVDQVADFASVFDQYRINSVEVYITNEGSNLNITNTGRLITVIDYDDATALSTIGQAADYSTALISSCQSCQYRRFSPRIATGAYTGAVFTGFANEAAKWIDMASTNVQHFGLKAAATATSSVMVFDLTIRFNLSFRAVR